MYGPGVSSRVCVALFYEPDIGESLRSRVHSFSGDLGWPDPHPCVLLCFIKPILGNRYGPGVSSCQQTSDNNLGVSGSSPFTLTMSLAIPTPSSSSSNGPSN